MPDQDQPPGESEPDTEQPGPRAEEPEVVETHQLAGQVIQQSVTFRQAPYPAPEELADYEKIHPGFTDRILTLTEREADHRMERERFRDSATVSLAKRGQTCAFIVVLTLVLGGIAAILTDHSIAGFAGLILAAATLAGTFIAPNLLGRRASSTDDSLPDNEIDGQVNPDDGSGT